MLTFVLPLLILFLGIIIVGKKVAGSQQLKGLPAVLKHVNSTNPTNPLTQAVLKATVLKEAAKPPSEVSIKETEEEAQPSDADFLKFLLEKDYQGQPTEDELQTWMNMALKSSEKKSSEQNSEVKLLSKNIREKYRRRKEKVLY